MVVLDVGGSEGRKLVEGEGLVGVLIAGVRPPPGSGPGFGGGPSRSITASGFDTRHGRPTDVRWYRRSVDVGFMGNAFDNLIMCGPPTSRWMESVTGV